MAGGSNAPVYSAIWKVRTTVSPAGTTVSGSQSLVIVDSAAMDNQRHIGLVGDGEGKAHTTQRVVGIRYHRGGDKVLLPGVVACDFLLGGPIGLQLRVEAGLDPRLMEGLGRARRREGLARRALVAVLILALIGVGAWEIHLWRTPVDLEVTETLIIYTDSSEGIS